MVLRHARPGAGPCRLPRHHGVSLSPTPQSSAPRSQQARPQGVGVYDGPDVVHVGTLLGRVVAVRWLDRPRRPRPSGRQRTDDARQLPARPGAGATRLRPPKRPWRRTGAHGLPGPDPGSVSRRVRTQIGSPRHTWTLDSSRRSFTGKTSAAPWGSPAVTPGTPSSEHSDVRLEHRSPSAARENFSPSSGSRQPTPTSRSATGRTPTARHCPCYSPPPDARQRSTIWTVQAPTPSQS